MDYLLILITLVVVIGFAGIIGNQYSGLKKMESVQKSLDDINQKLREMKSK
ncbi:ABC transporter ATP-binding protein [Paenibacillus rhizovicinus]|uniref:ABC transporter ATP-binding protein n=1 Tax=Paenibacillus rhizovicinus TaxID=2704463 RepID=A0A6C0P4F9_9BACL|nr:ABC transporter ATP-binding protein [Paenibacillus rhizovicinus]QHW33221.1 ABC transporter ATP-binding protein [Paenibacillus rhizovicinus]